MVLTFRNIDASPDDPVEEWGVEGILAAIDRGNVGDWRRIVAAVQKEPWGAVAEQVATAARLAEDVGAASALSGAVDHIRRRRETDERAQVAETLRTHLASSGLSQAQFAQRLGTSRTRFNTYLNGRVTPAATIMVRAEAVVETARRDLAG